jgi:ubiquinone/menaquinone biosynthesis C-methylase UbiE
MTETTKEQLNQEILWAGKSGDRWLANIDGFEGMIKPIGDALIKQAAFSQGEHIIDIGCGAGATSLLIAQKTGASGFVTGLDISPVLVNEATKRAEKLKLENIQFILGDAAVANLPTGQADCVFSRFGIMFFSNPYAAFTHIHGFLKPSGRLSIACWSSLPENPWMFEVVNTLAKYFPLPTPVPRAPGAFAFAEPNYVKEILQTSGFQDITISSWQHNLLIGGSNPSPELTAEFLLKATSLGQLPEDLSDTVKTAIHSELSNRLREYETKDGVQMPSSVWFVKARA